MVVFWCHEHKYKRAITILLVFKAEATLVCELIDASPMHHVATIND